MPDFDLDLKLAVYRHFAESGTRPSASLLGEQLGASRDEVRDGLGRLRAQRVMVLEADGASIRMAPPFSGIETQHVVISGGVRYYGNCAWDALGIPAALHRPATVHSRCEATLE